MSPPKDVKDLKLTFAVNLQCRATVSPALMSTLAAEFPNSRFRNHHGLVWYLAQLISARGIPVCSHLFTLAPIGDEVNYRKQWNFDLRRESTDAAGNAIFDLDVRSRVLVFNDLSYASMNHVPGALEEVEHVMNILKDCQVSFSVDSEHSLKVYLGLKKKSKNLLLLSNPNGEWHAEAFKLEELQALSALVTAAEPCIDAMVAPHRVHVEKCKTPSMTSGLNKMDVLKRIRKIGDARSVIELVELMNPHKGDNYAYSLNVLRSNKKTRDSHFSGGTVEFRQHEATLDPQEVTHWLQSIAGMARMSLRNDTLSRAKNWAVSCDGEEFTFQKFLEKIGKAHLISFYEQKPGRHFEKNQRNRTYGVDARRSAVSGTSSISSVALGSPVDESLNDWVIRNDLSEERRLYEERQKAKGTARSRTASSRADSSMTQNSRGSLAPRRVPSNRQGTAYSRSGSSRTDRRNSYGKPKQILSIQ